MVAERVGQVDGAPALLDHVGCPVPPVGRLQDHLGVLAGLGQLGGERHRVVVDANRIEGLPRFGPPHDHAAAPVQIDADVLLLLFHGSLLLSLPVWCGNPKCALHAWFRATGGLPLGLWLGSTGRGGALRWHGIIPSSSALELVRLPDARHAGAALDTSR